MINFSVPWLPLTRAAIIILSVLLAWVTYRSHRLLKHYQPEFNLLLAPPEFVMRLVLVGLCLLLAWLSGLPARQLGLMVNSPVQTIGLGAAIGAAVALLVNFLSYWSIKHFGRHIYSPLVIRNILPRHPAEWGLVAAAFLPAVAMEELLFRTLWLGGFSDIVPLSLLVVGTSILFGLMHQPQGQLGVIMAGGINIFFSILFVWSGQLLLPLTAHYVVNVLQLVMAHFQREQLNEF
jgi:membrane protease YdiL (CAAX protease family)